MRVAFWLLAACGVHPMHDRGDASIDTYDALSITDGGGQAWSALAGPTRAVWTLAPQICSDLSGPDCPHSTPSIFTAELATGTPQHWVSTRFGTAIDGDQDEVFYIDRDSEAGPFIARLRPTAFDQLPQAMTIPRQTFDGFTLDATHIYWSEWTTTGSMIWRASRSGDGRDAAIVLTSATRIAPIAFAGYLWWGSSRVPVTGGTPEQFTTETDWSPIAFGPDIMYVEQHLPPSGHTVRIGTMSADGVWTPIVDVPQPYAPYYVDSYGGELFYTTRAGPFFRLSAAGGTPVELPAIPWGPFAVTADSILYSFSANGYQAMPR